ncbi:MAG: SufD family Fe-S cluster assembly protein [Candidatus Marinamargulisbacteria bacterium]|nr:SufD family Fe-S cluster assembly protein [Candidatus Marinamargulisbacteria bacterium]
MSLPKSMSKFTDIYIDDQQVTPQHIDLQLDHNDQSASWHIQLANNAQAIVLYDQTATDAVSITESIQITLGDNARLCFLIQQALQPCTTVTQALHIGMGASSQLTSGIITQGGQRVDYSATAEFNAAGAHADFFGVSKITNKNRVDFNVNANHCTPDSSSNQTFRSIVHDTATSNHNSRVSVARNAKGTLTHQLSQHILLSKRASGNAKPELDILTDDVQCNHGATIGQLSSDALFYLQARGLSKIEAETLLLNAFLQDSLDQMAPEPIRKWLKAI